MIEAHNHSIQEIEVELKENEEIFGVYGVKDRFSHITTLGFIVKVRHN